MKHIVNNLHISINSCIDTIEETSCNMAINLYLFNSFEYAIRYL